MSTHTNDHTDYTRTERRGRAREGLPIPRVESPLEETVALACQLWLAGFIAGILLGLLAALLGIMA